jgi:hypothetical protein
LIGLSKTDVHTALKKVEGEDSTNWLGDLASAFIPQKEPAKDGSCIGLSAIGLSGLNCDMISNFVCQAPEPEKATKSTQTQPPTVADTTLPVKIEAAA